MSLEQTAYIERSSVPQLAELQTAIDELGFDCQVDRSYEPFQSKGFLPCVLAGSESGVEADFESASEVLQSFPHLAGTVGPRDVAITFRWGGDMAECACGLVLSAALASRFGAVVHYQDDDIIYSAEQLV